MLVHASMVGFNMELRSTKELLCFMAGIEGVATMLYYMAVLGVGTAVTIVRADVGGCASVGVTVWGGGRCGAGMGS